ncbi:MAG TPA: MBG domain-containing protein, partial [Vineibacter sp.]|nr:MBG domain-containing protein [Vineibacter sp.]
SDTTATVLTGGLSRAAGESVAGGPYAITQGSLVANSNYSISYTGANLTTTAAPLNVVADAKTKVYGDADPALTYTAAGFKFSDTAATVLSGGLTRAAGEIVAGGPYTISQGTLAANSNYSVSYTGANLTITPAPLNVVADAKTKVYGDADPALTFAATGFKFGETATVLTGSLSRVAGETVAGGPYAITQGTLAGANYAITYTGATLAITPAPLNVVADAKTKVYGAADPTLTFAAAGFMFGETAAVLTGSLARAAGESVAGGPFAITQGSLAGANYAITYTGANLTVTPAPLNVVADAKTKVFGDADPALTYTVSGFKFADTAATVLAGALSRVAGESVAGSPYAILQGTLAANANYAIAYTGASLTVTPLPAGRSTAITTPGVRSTGAGFDLLADLETNRSEVADQAVACRINPEGETVCAAF